MDSSKMNQSDGNSKSSVDDMVKRVAKTAMEKLMKDEQFLSELASSTISVPQSQSKTMAQSKYESNGLDSSTLLAPSLTESNSSSSSKTPSIDSSFKKSNDCIDLTGGEDDEEESEIEMENEKDDDGKKGEEREERGEEEREREKNGKGEVEKVKEQEKKKKRVRESENEPVIGSSGTYDVGEDKEVIQSSSAGSSSKAVAAASTSANSAASPSSSASPDSSDVLDFDQLSSIIEDKPIAMKTTDGGKLVFKFARDPKTKIVLLSGPGVDECGHSSCSDGFQRSHIWIKPSHYIDLHRVPSSSITRIKKLAREDWTWKSSHWIQYPSPSALTASILSDKKLLISRILPTNAELNPVANESARKAVKAVESGQEPLVLQEMTEIVFNMPIKAETKCGAGAILLVYMKGSLPSDCHIRFLASPKAEEGFRPRFFLNGIARSDFFIGGKSKWQKHHNLTESSFSKVKSLLHKEQTSVSKSKVDLPESSKRKAGSLSLSSYSFRDSAGSTSANSLSSSASPNSSDVLDFGQLTSIIEDKPIAMKTTDGGKLVFKFIQDRESKIVLLSGPGVNECGRSGCSNGFQRSQIWHCLSHFIDLHHVPSSSITKIKEFAREDRSRKQLIQYPSPSASTASILSNKKLLISRILPTYAELYPAAKKSARKAVKAVESGQEPLVLEEMTEIVLNVPIKAETNCGAGAILLFYMRGSTPSSCHVRFLASPKAEEGFPPRFLLNGIGRSELFKTEKSKWQQYHNLKAISLSKIESILPFTSERRLLSEYPFPAASTAAILSDKKLLMARIFPEGYELCPAAKESAQNALKEIESGKKPLLLDEMSEVVLNVPIAAETKRGNGAILLLYKKGPLISSSHVRFLACPYREEFPSKLFLNGIDRMTYNAEKSRWKKYHNLTESSLSKFESLLFKKQTSVSISKVDVPESSKRKAGSLSLSSYSFREKSPVNVAKTQRKKAAVVSSSASSSQVSKVKEKRMTPIQLPPTKRSKSESKSNQATKTSSEKGVKDTVETLKKELIEKDNLIREQQQTISKLESKLAYAEEINNKLMDKLVELAVKK